VTFHSSHSKNILIEYAGHTLVANRVLSSNHSNDWLQLFLTNFTVQLSDFFYSSYNQNFSGLYCKCARPYPDPEDSVDDLMLQCLICEDWYHGRHLGMEDIVPDQETFEEVTCEVCTDRCSFLRVYARVCSGKNIIFDVL